MENFTERTAPAGLYDSRFEHDNCGIGAVVSIDGKASHAIVNDALSIVERLEHRAGKDAAGETGDGVGILVQISHKFFAAAAASLGIALPAARDYGVGMFFFPQNTLARRQAQKMFEIICEKEGVKLLGWRDVPTDSSILGEKAKASMPFIAQCFVERPEKLARGLEFDRKLYVIRRVFEQSNDNTYVCSLSSRTVVYKGMFLVGQLRRFYADLRDESYESAIATVHSRFSTNTTPSWERAHPNRYILHNGEINTIRGNADRMLAREETMHSACMREDMDKVLPVINGNGSDSAMLDNTLEFLMMNGIPLPLAVMILIPEPWKNEPGISRSKRDLYRYYSTMMEPWDGPAAVLFSDGDLRESQRYMKLSVDAIMAIAFAIALGIVSVSRLFAPIFWGEDFAPCAYILSALALSIPFSGFANVIRMQYLIPNGMDGAYILSVILGAVSNLTANSLLIPRCGALGAAVGTVIAEGVVCAAQCLAVKKRIDILAYLKSTAFFGMAGLLMYGAVRVLDQRAEITVSWLLLEIVVGGSVYCILSVLYLYHTKNELLMTALQKLGGAHQNNDRG